MSNIIEIKDFNSQELDIYARLTEAQLLHFYEPKGGLFIAESPKVIERALDAGCAPVSILVERRHIEGQARDIIARCGNIPVYTAEFDVLTQLTGFQLTRGMLCAMLRPKLPIVEEVCANARRIAVLENVMNPTNIGAIFRSAAALNMDAVLLTPACSNPLYRRAIRVSMGTVFQIPWTYLGAENSDWLQSGIQQLHQLGFKTAAMALSDNSISIDNPKLMSEDKLAIILGTEGDGLAACTISDCDYTVRIPMSHGVDSLNVAAASAVAFWQLGNRQLRNYGVLDKEAELKDWYEISRRGSGEYLQFVVGSRIFEDTKEGIADEALAQIDEKRYDVEMKEDGIQDILKFGITFSGK